MSYDSSSTPNDPSECCQLQRRYKMTIYNGKYKEYAENHESGDFAQSPVK